MIIINGICLMQTQQISYKIVNLAGKILCYAPKPTYKSVRKQLSTVVNFRDRNTADFAIRIIDKENNEISVVFTELKGFEHIPDDELFSNVFINDVLFNDVLIIDRHTFSAVPPSIEYLTHLNYLQISNLGLTQLPSGIGKLINLDYLNISHNKLTDLPMSLKKLKKLCVLDLECNPFYEVPQVVMKIVSLRILHMRRDVRYYTLQYSDSISILRLTNPKLIIHDS